jgi:nucleoside-diphosphate-sugar epimerase
MASVAYQAHLKKENNKTNYLFPKRPQRDFVYVKDVVRANVHAWTNYDALKGNVYDVGSGSPREFEDVLTLMDIPYEHCEDSMIPQGYQFYTCSDKNKWMPGWAPHYTLEKGLEDYNNYLRKT